MEEKEPKVIQLNADKKLTKEQIDKMVEEVASIVKRNDPLH